MGQVVSIARFTLFPISRVEGGAMHEMKMCAKCQQEKPATSEFFSGTRGNADELHAYCNVEYQRDYRRRLKNGQPLVMEERAAERQASDTKKCSRCKTEFPKSEFYASWSGDNTLDGLKGTCKSCTRKSVSKSSRGRDWAARLVATALRRHNTYWPGDGEFDLTVEFLRERYEAQNGLCFWFGVELHVGIGSGLQQISLDRADCSRGYTQDNILITSKSANLARGDAPTDEFALLIRRLRAVKEEG